LPNKDNTCGKRFAQKNQGDLPDGYDHKYTYSHVGYNLKSTDLQAAIGVEQLKKLPDFVARRRHNWSYLSNKFEHYGLNKFFIMPTHYSNASPSFFGFPLTVKASSGFTRSDIVQHLESRMIGTRNLFGGNITKQPAFHGKGRIADTLPKADIVMESTFWIGVHPGIDEKQCDYIVSTFLEFIDSRK
jgi:CDP-6-deoxy-D-xylo-4-hexulose-3-dehydrase